MLHRTGATVTATAAPALGLTALKTCSASNAVQLGVFTVPALPSALFAGSKGAFASTSLTDAHSCDAEREKSECWEAVRATAPLNHSLLLRCLRSDRP